MAVIVEKVSLLNCPSTLSPILLFKNDVYHIMLKNVIIRFTTSYSFQLATH